MSIDQNVWKNGALQVGWDFLWLLIKGKETLKPFVFTAIIIKIVFLNGKPTPLLQQS